jgi:ricin-type beta-trefoil lectin protein
MVRRSPEHRLRSLPALTRLAPATSSTTYGSPRTPSAISAVPSRNWNRAAAPTGRTAIRATTPTRPPASWSTSGTTTAIPTMKGRSASAPVSAPTPWQSGRCVDVPGNSTTNGTTVALVGLQRRRQPELDADRQPSAPGLWQQAPRRARRRHSRRHRGADLRLQRRHQPAVDAPLRRLRGRRRSGKCLDATANATANGTLLHIWSCNDGANQKWSRA